VRRFVRVKRMREREKERRRMELHVFEKVSVA
jgi:hypothetical protein